MNRTPRLEGMHAATASTTGWIETNAVHGPQCQATRPRLELLAQAALVVPAV